MTIASVKSKRNKLLGKLHITAKQKGLDEDSYRDLLEQVTGKRSAKQMTDKQIMD